MTEPFLDPRRERDRRPIRFVAFGLAMVLVFSLLTVRLGYLQISNGRTYAARAEANRTVSVALPAPRGLIYDRKGRLLRRQRRLVRRQDQSRRTCPSTSATRSPPGWARSSNMQPSDILATLDSATGSRFDPVRVAQDVPEATARVVSESAAQLPGVQVVIETRRDYPMGTLMSQTPRLHRPDRPGNAGPAAGVRLPARRHHRARPGSSRRFEQTLRGTYGQELVERDATGKDVQVLKTTQQAVPGASLTLTIDTTVQKEAQKALQWGMQAAGLKRGVFIVMNPQTGEVLAMVSLPTYDDNLFAKGISSKDFQKLATDKTQPLINNAVQSQFAPGSTFKLVAGTGGLQDRKLTPTTLISTRPFVMIAGTKFWDWNHRGFGMCNINCGFGNSSDTFFYQVATMLGADRLAYYAHAYGFGQPTGHRPPRRGRRASSRRTSGR